MRRLKRGVFFNIKKEALVMNNVIKVKPNSKGEIFITLYGTKYQIVVEEPAKETTKKAEKNS